jgi:ribosomal protein RSM22 (predicted rRNA methylase)
MELPKTLVDSITTHFSEYGMKKIQKAAHELSLRYREKQNTNTRFIQTKEEAIAYLCMRFPATFAVNYRVFSELEKYIDLTSVSSLLDLGSGSGASLFAAQSIFPHLNQACLVEQDSFLIDLGKTLFKESGVHVKPAWLCENFTSLVKASPAELVVFSYSIGEAPKNSFGEIFEHILPFVNKYLVIIEPGTPVGFERILHARDILLKKGLHILAPCPHAKTCPMNKTFKWCHFTQRLPRTSFHKYLKDASLGYEDEKFSYIIMSKKELSAPQDRIVGHPKISSGFAEFEVCSVEGALETKKILKRNVENFGILKKLEWGNVLIE